MKKFASRFALLLFSSISLTAFGQGCSIDQNAGNVEGIYPEGPMQMDCSGVNSYKTIVGTVDDSTLSAFGSIMKISALRINQVVGVPNGLTFQTDVMASATADSPYGVWYSEVIGGDTLPARGCFNIYGSTADWNSASTGGSNGDGVFHIGFLLDVYVDTISPAFPLFDLNNNWLSDGLSVLGQSTDTLWVELHVNESACDGDLSVMTNVTADNDLTPDCDGSATVEVFYGEPPYTYQFSTGANSASVSDLCQGIYTVDVTDNTGATATGTFAVGTTSNVFNGEPWPIGVDTLFSSAWNCDLDYNLPIDSFEIVDAVTIGNDTCFVEWIVYQQGEPFTVGSFYPFIGFDPTVFSLVLYCENGRAEVGVFQVFEYLDLSSGTTEVEEITATRKIETWPNPTTGLLQLKGVKPGWPIEIHDLTGKKVHASMTSRAQHQLDLSQLRSGIYLLSVRGEGILFQNKVLLVD